jgi:hypothetical protein
LETAVKLCKDCGWAEDKSLGSIQWWVCHHTTSSRPPLVDYIRGKPQAPRLRDCTTMRDDPNLCRPDGRLWETRPGESDEVVGFGQDGA